MILLDTNVISEPLKASGNTSVLVWIDAQIIKRCTFRRSVLQNSVAVSLCCRMVSARICSIRVLNSAPADGYIAAIAATHGFAVATRDTSPFGAAGLTVINPWTWPTSQQGNRAMKL